MKKTVKIGFWLWLRQKVTLTNIKRGLRALHKILVDQLLETMVGVFLMVIPIFWVSEINLPIHLWTLVLVSGVSGVSEVSGFLLACHSWYRNEMEDC